MPILNMIYWATGGTPTREPWADTVAYYPLEANTNDYSGNNRNAVSTTWNLTFTTSTDGYACANFPWSTYIEYWTQWSQINYWTTWCTIALWLWDIGNNAGTSYDTNGVLSWHVASDNNILIWIASSNNVWGTGNLMFVSKNQAQAVTNSSLYNTNWMHLYTFTTATDGTMKYYKDSVLVGTYSFNFSSTPSWDDCKIWWNNRDTRQRRYYKGKMRQVVFEKKTRTADDVLLYYNTTK